MGRYFFKALNLGARVGSTLEIPMHHSAYGPQQLLQKSRNIPLFGEVFSSVPGTGEPGLSALCS